jgi:hypothetical protein
MAACPRCGTENADTARFCSSCGRPLTAATGPAQDGNSTTDESLKPRIRTRIPRFVKDTLSPSESILAAFHASLFDHHKQGTSLAHDKFVLTSERLIFYHTGLFHRGMGEMPYRMITGVNYEQGILHGKVIVEAANAGLTLDGIGNADAAFAEKIIAGGMAGRRFGTTGPIDEPPLIGPLAVAVFALIAVVAAAVVFFGPSLLHQLPIIH